MEYCKSKFWGNTLGTPVSSCGASNELFIYSGILIISGKYSLSVPVDLVIWHICTLIGSKTHFLLECVFSDLLPSVHFSYDMQKTPMKQDRILWTIPFIQCMLEKQTTHLFCLAVKLYFSFQENCTFESSLICFKIFEDKKNIRHKAKWSSSTTCYLKIAEKIRWEVLHHLCSGCTAFNVTSRTTCNVQCV